MEEQVILVDESDKPVGTIDKLAAHEKGLLHRAFSVFIYNQSGQMLLQRRAVKKYHSGGLWTNTCCSHPRPGEDNLAAAKRRLAEEMGLEVKLEHRGSFIYKAEVPGFLTEHELDHIFTGVTDQQPFLNKEEAEDYAWCSAAEIAAAVQQHPERYTEWFKIAVREHADRIRPSLQHP